MEINEMIYTITNKPYFKVYIKSHGRIIRTFTQAAGATDNTAKSFFLICEPLKCAWWKPFNPVIEGLKFITYVDLSNAVPLKFEKETVYLSTNFLVKETEHYTITEDLDKQSENKKRKGKENDGMPEKLVEIAVPPDLLYEKVEAHFIKKILTPPANKMDLFKNKWLLILIIGAIAFWWISNNGGKLI